VIRQIKQSSPRTDQLHGLTTNGTLVEATSMSTAYTVTRRAPTNRVVLPMRQPPHDKYCVVALASTVSDVVLNAGGYLFECAASGWDVTVYLEDWAHRRALEILGISAAELQNVLDVRTEKQCPQVIVTSAALYEPRKPTRRYIRSAIDRHAEVVMWGRSECTSTRPVVKYHLSAAARAFKQQALIATAQPAVPRLDATETFSHNPV
jgi:hypothetical protein